MVKLLHSGRRHLDERIVGPQLSHSVVCPHDHQNCLNKDLGNPPFVFGATTAEGDLYVRGSGTRIVGDPTSGDVDGDTAFWICSEGNLLSTYVHVPVSARSLLTRGQHDSLQLSSS